MANSLMFPEGVRLAHLDELPGSEAEREQAWSRIQAAEIRSGFVLSESGDSRFAFYGEANVHAPKVWGVFRDLCVALLGNQATLLMSEIDDEPSPLGTAEVRLILELLEPHDYQLAHDGFFQFGLIRQDDYEISEVFVAPTKHFKLWLQDAELLRSIMRRHDVPEVECLQFIDEFPRTTTRLAFEKTAFQGSAELIHHMATVLEASSDA